MTCGNVRRLAAAGLALACVIALPGQAGADDAPAVSIADVNAAEGNSGTTSVALTVTRAPSPEESSVTAIVSGGSTEVEDYAAASPQVLTFPAATEPTARTVMVSFNGDTVYEDDETFSVSLADPSNATIGDGVAQGTLENDDAPPAAAVTGPAADVPEGGSASFTIRLAAKAERTVNVQYRTENGTAKAGEDYGAADTSVTFTAGEQDKTISVATPVEALDEDDRESFSVVLPSTGSSANATIVDNDDPPLATIANAPEVKEGGLAKFPVSLSGPSGRTVNVTYRTTNGSAVSGSDFQGTPGGSIQIPAGGRTGEIAVQTLEDTAREGDESFAVVLTANATLRLGTPNEATAKILDNQPPAELSITAGLVTEGNSGETTLKFTLKLSAASAQPVLVTASTSGGTASAGVDYEPKTQRFTFAPTQTEKVFEVTVKGDGLDEPNETVRVVLSDPDPVSTPLLPSDALGTIVNDDNNSKLSISDATADEPGTMRFIVTLSSASARDVGVSWATADGTATAGADYTAGSGTLTFAAGETSKSIDIAVLGDTINEENETLKVNLSGATGVPEANLIDPQGDGTIVDKNAPPSLSINDVLVREGEGANFTVTLAGTTLRTVTVRFSTGDGSATAGADYTARVGTLTFAPGEKSKAVAVTVLDDTAAEPVENFLVTLGDATNGSITKSRGVASIEASDQATVADVPTPPTKQPDVKKPTARLVPRMILGPRTVTVGVNGIARMLVTCQKVSPIGCAGTVELERAVKPLVKLGKKTFTVKKGTKGYASIRLTARGLAILRKNGTLRAKVIVHVKTSTKAMRVSPGIITLKGTKALMKAKPKPAAPPTQVVVNP